MKAGNRARGWQVQPDAGDAMLPAMSNSASSAGRVRFAVLLAGAFGVLAVVFGWRAYASLAEAIANDPAHLKERFANELVIMVVAAVVCGFAIALAASSVAVAPLIDMRRVATAMRADLGIRTGVRGGDEVGMLGEALDNLADWVATEKSSLEEDRNRLAAILDSMTEGVLVTQASDGSVALANASLREMLLLDRSILGRSPIEAIRIAGLDDILNAAQRGEASGEIELGGLRPRRLLVRAAPLRGGDPKGKRGLVAVFNDVTDLRRLETMRRDFVANVSHELRTPIAAIRAAADTLANGALRDPEAAGSFVDIVGRHATRLQALVEDLLELSRIEARQWRLEMTPVEARAAAQAAIDTVSAAAKERGTTLRNLVDDHFGATRADRRAVEQVLVNLLDNAVKYAGAGAVVEVRARRDGARVSLSVQDDGPGIEKKHLSRLFERFYRVDAGRSRAVGGTGLGLAICKHLVEAMGGTIEVQSQPGVGTSFTMNLRDDEAPKDASPPLRDSNATNAAGVESAESAAEPPPG
jgi:two-component system phosphate regulon sensor histidine kinase PhoR